MNASGSGNVFLGYEAGADETGSNKLYIDNSNTTTPLVYGDFSDNQLTINGSVNITEVMNLTPLATEPSNPKAGDIYFDSTLGRHRGYDGTQWNNLY